MRGGWSFQMTQGIGGCETPWVIVELMGGKLSWRGRWFFFSLDIRINQRSCSSWQACSEWKIWGVSVGQHVHGAQCGKTLDTLSYKPSSSNPWVISCPIARPIPPYATDLQSVLEFCLKKNLQSYSNTMHKHFITPHATRLLLISNKNTQNDANKTFWMNKMKQKSHVRCLFMTRLGFVCVFVCFGRVTLGCGVPGWGGLKMTVILCEDRGTIFAQTALDMGLTSVGGSIAPTGQKLQVGPSLFDIICLIRIPAQFEVPCKLISYPCSADLPA